VLELFTSQGCSSCPPADALLSELGASTRSLIPLAFHVDYWNHLGWSDPFSSRQFSQRQSEYARAMNLGDVYTPQMVIAGGWECVGSDRGAIARAIVAARSAPRVMRVSLHAVRNPSNPRQVQARVKVEASPAAGSGRVALMVAIYENGLVTEIGAGENSGRKITYDYTVRRLIKAAELDVAPGSSAVKELRIAADPSWSPAHLGMAAFIQSPGSLKISAAASEYPIAAN